jgi:integrase
MTHDLVPVHSQSIGQLANQHAAKVVFTDYQQRTAVNTLRRQRDDLALFSRYLGLVGIAITEDAFLSDPAVWAPITHGLVDGFVRWQLQQGYAIGSINVHLSTIKKYCALAARAGTLATEEIALIKLVQGYRHKEGRNIDANRERTRVGAKKADAVQIDVGQAATLKAQLDTDQGRRDTLLVCLLLDHGLRCGEIADLPVDAINLDTGILTFYRKKVDKVQHHELTRDTWIAARRYFDVAKPENFLLMGSRKGGKLEGRMSERAITARVEKLCREVGLEGASAHDCRHAWATFAVAGGTDIKSLQDAGGWSSIAMPARYAESSKIANRGVKLVSNSSP